MTANNERRELVPVMIATIVAAIGAFFLWSDLTSDSLGRGSGMITSAVVSQAGVIEVRLEPFGVNAELGARRFQPRIAPN